MRSMKRFLSLTLLILLFSSEISLCSWSWWESIVKAPLQSIAQSIDGDTAKKLFPLVLLASVIGFYYWMSKKDKGSNEESGKLPPRVPSFSALQSQTPLAPSIIPVSSVSVATSPTTTTTVTQPVSGEMSAYKKPQDLLTPYRVYSQTESNGGGAASCGYHALLRSMQVVASKSENEYEKDLIERLQEPWAIEIYFGNSDSDWRKKIIMKRKKKILKDELHTKFLAVLEEGKDAKTVELYKSAFGDLEQVIIGLVDDVVGGNKEYDFTSDAIKEYIRAGLKKLKNTENEKKIEELEDSIIMKEHLSISGIGAAVSAESILRPSELLEEITQRPDPTKLFQGDWLDDGELEFLWKYEREKKRNSLVPDAITCALKTVENPNNIGKEYVDEVTPFVKEQIANNLGQQKPWFLIFVIGEGMSQIGDTGRTSGHWYGLVMYQNNAGDRRYYIMDSMNYSRTNDKTAKKIIDIIEYYVLHPQQLGL